MTEWAWYRALTLRLRSVMQREAVERDLHDELSYHLEQTTNALIAGGFTPAQARAAALHELGNIETTKELVRDTWHVRLWDQLRHEFELAIRSVSRARLFYVGTVLTLTIGIAGATVMFALIQGILLRPLPVPDEDRLLLSWRTPPTGAAAHMPYRATDVAEIARTTTLLEGVTGVGYNGAFDVTWSDGDTPFVAKTSAVMGGFFQVAGVAPVLGRGLNDDDAHSGAAKTVVLSHTAWRRLFGGSRDVIGRHLLTHGHAFTVVGIMPPDFEYPRGVEFWTTLTALAATETNEAFRTGLLRDVELFGRMRPLVTYEQVGTELSALVSQLDAQVSAAQGTVGFRPVIQPYKRVIVGDFDKTLMILFGAVLLMLVVATANVANLMLVRSEDRRPEFAVRAALGARRAHIIRHVTAESLIVAVAAGGAALLVSHWALSIVNMLVPNGLPRATSIRVDPVVILFAGVVSVLAAALASLLPALGVFKLDLTAGLRSAGRGLAGAHTRLGRRALVIGQVGLTLILIASAAVLMRSLSLLQTVDMGFAHEGIVFAELDMPRDAYADQERCRQFLEAVGEQLSVVPGIDSVTPVAVLPFAGATGWDVPRFTVEGQAAEQVAENPVLNFEAVHPNYFATLGVPLRRGRSFVPADRRDAPLVAIVSEDVAARAWPQQDPIGKRLKMGGISTRNPWLTVVGVVAVTRYRELASPRPTLYVPAEQFMITAANFALRTGADLSLVAGAVRGSVRATDPGVRVLRIARYSEYLARPLAWPRFNTLLLQVFAVAALLLSCVGLYGVLATSVRQRHAEIGLRMALGATIGDIRRMVLTEGMRLSVIGIVVGLGVMIPLSRALRNLLFEISPLDPPTLLAAAITLVGGSIAASFLPALRATKVAPLDLLRGE